MITAKKFTFKYFEKGKEFERDINISWVSNRATRDYNDLIQDAALVKDKWNEIQDITLQNSVLRTERPADYKKTIKENQEKIKKITVEIRNLGEGDFFERRFNIIKRILIDNSIEDETLLSFEFWDEKVDPSDMMGFLASVVYKDIDLNTAKKKTPN